MYALTPPIWREPQQERSRIRVHAILETARQIIGETGVEGLQMRALSKQANVPIGTLYQFFDDREAILACLAARYLSWQDQELTQRFHDIDSVDGWLKAVEGATAVFYQRNLDDPAIAKILRTANTNKAIQEIDNASTAHHSKLLFEMLRPFIPKRTSDQELEMTCRMVCELAATAIERALPLPKKNGALYIAQFEAMVRARLAEMIEL